jgi:uncharacterized protein (TIGR02413 family)
MTLNLLFITISVEKRDRSVEEAAHQEMVKKLYEEKEAHRMCNSNLF